MQDQPLVSVIMPAYNAASFITTAIQSVLNQSYGNWELLVVNDGSKDETAQFVKAFKDPRIRYFEQKNQGVSAARNLALKNMRGDFFCFLDADDAYPKGSVKARLQVFKENQEIEFVDGTVVRKDRELKEILSVKKHTFVGNPRAALIRLDERCFFGPSWMIKVKSEKDYSFKTGMTHGEDLLFYISISASGFYSATSEEVLYYRTGNESAMKNLDGLQQGYKELYQAVQQLSPQFKRELSYLKRRIRRILFLSYLRKGSLIKAINVFFSITRL